MSRTLGSLTKADLGEHLIAEEWWVPSDPLAMPPAGKHIVLAGAKHEFYSDGSELTTIYTDTIECPSWTGPSNAIVRVASEGD